MFLCNIYRNDLFTVDPYAKGDQVFLNPIFVDPYPNGSGVPLRRNMDFFMQSADLTKPGFQSHHTAVRYFIMHQRLKDLSEKLLEDSAFGAFQKTLSLKDKTGGTH